MIFIAIFVVIGFSSARLTATTIGQYSNNPILFEFIGAFIGLIITIYVMKAFFAKADWMQEAIYSLNLKRTLMKINNHLRPLQTAEKDNDEIAIKTLRYYHIGLQQMNKLENNSHALIDMAAEMKQLEAKMIERNMDLEQLTFDEKVLESYPINESHQS